MIAIIEPMPKPINHKAVALAEHVLEKLKAGEFTSFGYIATSNNKLCDNGLSISDNDNLIFLLGVATRLCNRINAEVSDASTYY